MNTKSRLVAVIIGALVTLVLGGVAFTILVLYYPSNIPIVMAALATFLCSLGGGYVATRLAQIRELITGALSGLVAGLVMLLVATVVTSLAVKSTLASLLLIIVWIAGGALGAWLTRLRLSWELV